MAELFGGQSKLTIDDGSGLVTLCITSFEFEQKYDEFSSDNTCQGAYKTQILGKKQIVFTGAATYQLGVNEPFVHVQNGSSASIIYYAVGSGSATLTMPTCTIESCKVSSPANGMITYTFSGKSNGSYTVV